MGDSWNKKPEDWVEEMKIVDAEAKKPEGAENESVEHLSSAGRIVLNKCGSPEGSRLRSLMERTVLMWRLPKSCKSVAEIKRHCR